MTEPVDQRIKAAAHSSRCKVIWAKIHIREVEKCIKTLTGGDAYVIESERNPQTGYYGLYVGPKDHGWPIELFMHTGDAVHNLNCVMDHLWSGLARTVQPDLDSKITFPRDETRENLVTRFRDAKGYHTAIQKAFPEADSFVLDRVQPYKRNDGLIWPLNKLDNINKHRRFLAAYHVTRMGRKFIARSKDGSVMDISGATFQNSQGTPFPMTFAAPFEVEYDVKPTVDISFAEPDLFPREPILETLVNLAEATTEVIDAFEEIFLTRHGVTPTQGTDPG